MAAITFNPADILKMTNNQVANRLTNENTNENLMQINPPQIIGGFSLPNSFGSPAINQSNYEPFSTVGFTPSQPSQPGDEGLIYLEDVPIPLSPNNPYLAYFPKKGNGLVATRKLMAQAIDWENQNAIQQGTDLKSQREQEQRRQLAQYAINLVNAAKANLAPDDPRLGLLRFDTQLADILQTSEGASLIPQVIADVRNASGPYTQAKEAVDLNAVYNFAQGLHKENPARQALLNANENTSANLIQDLMQAGNQYENYLMDYWKKGSGGQSLTSDPEYMRRKNQYDAAMKTYNQYVQTTIKNKIGTDDLGNSVYEKPKKLEQWLIEHYGKDAAQDIMDFVRDPNNENLKGRIPVDMSSVGREMLANIPTSLGISADDVIAVDKMIRDAGNSFTNAFISAYQNPNTPPTYLLTFAERWNRYHKKQGKKTVIQLYNYLTRKKG